MLTVLASSPIHPEVEPIDRDPGFITLMASLVKGLHSLCSRTVARFRAAYQTSVEAELFSSSNSWPYNHRL